MKGVGLLLCLICVSVSASFNDELHGAIYSVQQGFGKLLRDAVVDLTNTVHCTISAVEHVLTLNGLIKTKSEYGNKCRDGPVAAIDNSNDPLKNFLKLRDAIEERTFKETGPQDLYASIAEVNTTLATVLDNHDNQQKIHSISKVLKGETDQLTRVSNILRHELSTISNNVNTELRKFEHISAPSVWSKLERKINNHQVNAANTVHTSEGTQKIGNENKKLKKAHNDQHSFNKVKREFEHLRDDIQESTDKVPKTFRDVTRNIRNNDHNDDSTKRKRISSGSVFSVDNSHLDQLSPFYDPASDNEETRKKVVEQAVGIISDSQRNEEIINKLFKKAQVSSVFGENF